MTPALFFYVQKFLFSPSSNFVTYIPGTIFLHPNFEIFPD